MWDQVKTLFCIKLWEEKKILYDKSHEGFNCKEKKLQAMEEIARKLNVSVDELLKKMHSLTTAFRRERKLLQERSNSGGEPKIPWFGYKYLQFLTPKKRSIVTVGDCQMLSEEVSIKPEFGESFKHNYEVTKFFDDDNTCMTIMHKENGNTPEPMDNILDDESTREAEYPIISPDKIVEENLKQDNNNSQDAVFVPPPTKRRKTIEYQNEISIQQRRNTDCSSETSIREQYQNIHSSAEYQSRDELKLFVELVEQRLRKIRDKRNLCILKHDIETLLFNAEIKEYDSSAQLHSPAYSSDT